MKKIANSIIVLLISSSAAAQLSESFSTYFEGPEGFLITKKERKAWKKTTSDAEAEEFIELFWAKRDPDLSTPVNEFRQDFIRRVEAADAMFAYGSTRGALSDRARVLILLGQFSRRDNRPPGADASGVQNPNTATGGESRLVASSSLYQNRGSKETWEYRGEDLPVRIGQTFVHAVFLETNVEDNDYILDRSNASLMYVLSKMPEALITNLDLTEVPRIGLIPGSRSASADQLKLFDADPRPWPGEAGAIATAGLAPGPRHFLWLHLSMAKGSAVATSLAGRVRAAASGEEIGSFVVDLDDVTIGNDAYELSIPINEGQWLLDFALIGDAGPLAVKTAEVETAEVPATGTAVSPFCWGTDVRREPNSKFGDPFNIGGWRVVPILSNTFPTSSNDRLSFLAYVLEPELGSDGEPQFVVTISLDKDGTRVARTPSQPAALTKVTDGVWIFGSGLPLERFKQPGAYKLEVELKQTTDGAKGIVEIPFEIVEGISVGNGS